MRTTFGSLCTLTPALNTLCGYQPDPKCLRTNMETSRWHRTMGGVWNYGIWRDAQARLCICLSHCRSGGRMLKNWSFFLGEKRTCELIVVYRRQLHLSLRVCTGPFLLIERSHGLWNILSRWPPPLPDQRKGVIFHRWAACDRWEIVWVGHRMRGMGVRRWRLMSIVVGWCQWSAVSWKHVWHFVRVPLLLPFLCSV